MVSTGSAGGGRYGYHNMRHLPDLPKGEVTIHMYVGGNDHRVWMVDGEPFFIEETFIVE